MMNRKILCLLLTFTFFVGINSICCHRFVWTCADCTQSATCCGHGACNVFCCNCDGGCRTGPCEPPSLDLANYYKQGSSVAQIIFKSVDKNEDGKLSFEEVYAKYGNQHDIKTEFPKMDTNHDGFITIDEMDSDEK